MDKVQISAAAVKDVFGRVWTTAPPGRHRDILGVMRDWGMAVENYGEEGFVDTAGTFHSRLEAFKSDLNDALAERQVLVDAIRAMADDGWLAHGPEGMSEAQKMCHAAYQLIGDE